MSDDKDKDQADGENLISELSDSELDNADGGFFTYNPDATTTISTTLSTTTISPDQDPNLITSTENLQSGAESMLRVRPGRFGNW